MSKKIHFLVWGQKFIRGQDVQLYTLLFFSVFNKMKTIRKNKFKSLMWLKLCITKMGWTEINFQEYSQKKIKFSTWKTERKKSISSGENHKCDRRSGAAESVVCSTLKCNFKLHNSKVKYRLKQLFDGKMQLRFSEKFCDWKKFFAVQNFDKIRNTKPKWFGFWKFHTF